MKYCILALLLLAGCTTNSLQTKSFLEEYQSAAEYLTKASQVPPIQELAYRIKAADLCIQNKEIYEAQQILRETQAQNIDIAIHKSILTARLALLQKDNSKARALLNTILNALQRRYFIATSLQASNEHLRIALLLPSKGPHAEAAKMIQAGFLTAYYQDMQKRTQPNTVKIYDTGEGANIREAYNNAIRDKVNFIVGPLTKTELQTMITKMRIKVPVLALNTLNERHTLPPELYQFGLMPEDEVAAVGDYALRQGKQKALILAQQNEWGERLVHTFKSFWTSHGGSIIDTSFFKTGQNLEDKIRLLLKVDQQGHRQDADMLFIAASSETARQIKQLLNLHLSQDLPVYATSSVYTGVPMPSQDQVLNGVYFCDMPWILEPSSHSGTQLPVEKTPAKKLNQSPRFFALGLDAYQLSMQLGEAKQLPSYGISGHTGNLHLSGYQRIERGLVCARFEQGIPVPHY